MAKYKITAPDGNSYEVNAPDTATESEVMAYAKANYQQTDTQQEHPISQNYPGADEYSSVGRAAGYVGRKAYGVGKEALDQVGGMAETGLALGSGLLQLPVKAMAGIGGLARGISTDSQDEAVKTIRGIEDFGQKFAYQPKFTESGKRVAAGMGELFSLPKRVGEWAGDKAQDITSPYIGERYAAPLGAGFAIIGEAAPYFIGGKKMGGVKTAEKVVQKLIPSTMPIERHIATIVRKGTERGIKPSPSIVGRTFKERESYYDKSRMVVEDIVKNKEGIELLDKHGEPLKGIVPKTVENYDHAIQQGVNRVFNSFNDKAVATTGKGIMVDVSPTVKGLKEMTTGEIGESLQRTSPETFRYASEMLKKYEDVHTTGGLTATAAQRDIMTLNVGQKTVKDYTTIHKAGVDSDILESLRYATDKAITSTEGIGYQADKNLYGAYRSQQKAVNRMATKVGEKTGGLFGDYADVYTGFHAIKGLLLHDPSTLLASAGAKIIKETQKHVKHSDTIVRNMFKTTEKLMAKRPVAPPIPSDALGKSPVDYGRTKNIERLVEEGNVAAIHDLAYKDPLTGILNRKAFDEAYPQAIKQGKNFASLDVSKLKKINDTYGHEAGDILLKEYTKAIKDAGADVYRVGGDETYVIFGKGDYGKLRKAQLNFSLKEIPVKDVDGNTVILKGSRFDFGIGRTIKEGDISLIKKRTKRALERKTPKVEENPKEAQLTDPAGIRE